MAATKQHQPQHCLRNEVISYDSDDEMVRSSGHRRSVYGTRTTKNGHPIYSREDIREQYCITRTELCVFEDGAYQESRLFGCLSTSHLPDHSPCNRNSSFLLSCVQKRKSSVDLDRKPSSTSLSNSSKQHERSVDDDEDSDGGFKRRPKPKTCLVSQQEHYRHTWASSSCSVPYSRPCSQEEVDIHHGRHCGQQGIQHHQQQPPQPLDNVCSHYSAQQGTNVFYGHHQPLSQIQSFNGYVQHCPPNGAPYCWPQSTATCSNQPRQDIRNGAHGLCGLETMYGRGSHSVDELNGHPNGHHVWHGHPQNQYGASSATMARTPDLLQTGGGGGGGEGDHYDCRPKHVSFYDTNSLVRSNTIAGGLKENVLSQSSAQLPGGQFAPSSSQRADHFGPYYASQLPTTVHPHQQPMSASALPSLASHSHSQSHHRQVPIRIHQPVTGSSSNLRLIRRAVMKTQATQTPKIVAEQRRLEREKRERENASAQVRDALSYRSIPEYLTLSPRSSTSSRTAWQHRRHSAHFHYNRHPLHPPAGAGSRSRPVSVMTGSVHHRQTGKFEQSTGQEPVETVPSSLSSPLRPLELCADAPTEVSACSLPDPVVMSVPIGTSLDGDDEDDDIGLDRRSKVKNLTIVRVRAKQQRLKQYVTSESDTIGQLSDDCPSELLERPASKSQSSDAIEELKATCVNQEEACEFRRHSIDQLLCVAKLSPPLGFHDLPEAENEPKLTETSAELDGEQIEEVTINATDKLSEGDSESSSTSRAVCTNSVSDGDQQSTTGNASELDELDSSLKSNGSQTLISDLASESKSTSSRPEVADRVADASIAIEPAPASQVRGRLTREKTFDHGNRHHVTAPLVHAKTLPEALNSPESEASSQVTEQSSKTESTSSLPLKETLDEGVEDETKGSGSSVYVTATEHSPKGDLSRERSSFETASPANVSLFSSPSSSGKRKSSSSDADCGPLPPELAIDSKITAKGSSANTRLHLLVSPPKQDGERRRSHDERSESSEDSSTRRGSDCWLGSPGSESLGSRILDHGEELDSEDGIGFGDVTPMCELYSSDPSTAFEATTVIENVPDLISISKEVTNRIVSAAITAASAQVAPQSAHVPTMSSHGEQEPETRANESRPDSFGSPCQDIVEANSLEEAAGEDDAESVIEKTISEEIELSEGSEQGEEKKGAKVKVEPDVEKREERGAIDDEDAGQRAESEKSTVTSSFPGDNPEVFTQLDMADLLLAGVAGFCHRSLSGELSTVSEVSEEVSNQRSSQDVSISSVTSSTDSGSEKAGSDKMATLKRKRSDGHSRKKASDLDMEGYDDVKYCGSKSPSPEACKEKRTGQSLPSSDDEEHTSGSFVIDGQLESESHEPESISDESHRNSSAVERTTASIAGLSTEDSANVKQGEATDDVHEQDEVEEEEDEDDEDQESSPGSFRQLEESKDISPEKLQTETPPRDMVVALIEAEASQATERDLAKFSFSLGQQSSQELDDDSLSMTGATCSHTPSKEQFSADWETSTTYTPPAAAPKPPLLPKPAMYRLTQVPPGAPLRQGQGFPLRHSRLQQQQNVEASSSDSSACRKRELMQRRTKSLSKSPERQQFSSEQSNVYRLPCQLQRGYRFLPSSESTSSGLVHATDEEHCPQPFATMPTVRPAQPIYRRSSTMDDIMSMSSIEAPDQLERPSSAETDEESHLDMLKPKAEVAAEPRARGIIIASSSIHDDKGRGDETKPVPWQTTSNSDIAGSSGSHRIVELEGRACSSEPGQARSTELNQRELGAERRKEDGKGSKQSEPSTRRMIYRKSAIEMYRKLVSNSLSDQERASAQRLVQISRNNGEFGFRIHGSRPVMISAIEPGTPAEISGMVVGDVIVQLNGVDVLRTSHTEIVKLAQSGTETLEMLLVRPAQEAEVESKPTSE